MIIRKLYRIESAHCVLNAFSERCSQNYHGHSGVIEVFLTSRFPDNAGMVIDFGKLKNNIGSFIDMFDHSVHIWNQDKNIKTLKKLNQRYIVLPCNPTAENYSLLFKDCINELLQYVDCCNGEMGVSCVGVRYHETSTGYAESEEQDCGGFSIGSLEFSAQTVFESSGWIKDVLNQIELDKQLELEEK